MTNTVKRYSYGFHADGFGEGRTLGLIEKEDGNLVRYEDYELLREQRDSFQRVRILAMEERDRDAAARDQYRALSIKYGDKLSETLKERDALRAELAAIKRRELRADQVKAQLLKAADNAVDVFSDECRRRLGEIEAVQQMQAAIAAARKEGGE